MTFSHFWIPVLHFPAKKNQNGYDIKFIPGSYIKMDT